MENNSESKYTISTIFVIISILAIGGAVAAFAFMVTPQTLEPGPTAIPSTPVPSSSYRPEVLPPSNEGPSPELTVIPSPTETRAATVMPTASSGPPLSKGPLPDLIVERIGTPVCLQDNYQGVERRYIKFTVIVRNIGQASTLHFGVFNVDLYILIGRRSYRLDEWASIFDGVIGNPNIIIRNIDPGKSVTFSVTIYIMEIRNFGIKAIVNTGANPIPESDGLNNTLIKYFSFYCYESN